MLRRGIQLPFVPHRHAEVVVREAVVRSQAQRLPGVGEALLGLVFDVVEQIAQALVRVHVAGLISSAL